MLCKGITHERLLLREGQMAVRFRGCGVHGLSLATFPSVKPSCQLHCHFPIVKASLSASTQARDNGFPLVSEESSPVVSKKKERLSRDERAAVVESFVLKYMEAHHGAFPNVTSVLKSTGGSRNVVKDILSNLENRYAQPISRQNLSDHVSTEDDPNKADGVQDLESYNAIADNEDDEAAVYNILELKEEEDELHTLGNEDAQYEDEEEDAEEELGEPEERTSGKQEAERKSVTSNNGGTTGSSKGESETHSRLSSRLRGMGIANSLQQLSTRDSSEPQGSSRRFRPTGLAGSYLPTQDLSESESNKENGRVPEWQTLSYSNVPDREPKNATHSGVRMKDVSETGSSERHGLFVRYLSCYATSADLKDAFVDCGEIVRAYAIKARPNVKYTYGFVDFKTFEGLQKALGKNNVYIKGARIVTEPSTTSPNHISSKNGDDSPNSNSGAAEFGSPPATEKVAGIYQDTSNVKEFRGSGYKLAVMGIPMNVPLSEVQGALSKYGEIILSDMKQENLGTYSANLEFKAIDSRDRALSAKSVQLNGSQYSILRVNPLKTSVVRLSNVGIEANIDQIGATCELFGRVQEVVARCDSSVDVYFQSTEVENMPRILTRLNEVTMDGRRWQARPSPCWGSSSYESLLKTRDGQEWLQLESERRLTNIESALKKLVVDVEDLQELVKVIKNRNYMGFAKNGGN